MPEQCLHGCRILIVEDEYILADELQTELGDADAIVLGPVGNLEEALDLIRSEIRIDGAILHVNLRGQAAFPAADLLTERGVPFVFTTGYDQSAIPSRFEHICRCEKPVNLERVKNAIGHVVHA